MTHADSPVVYDRSTDTMYVALREGRLAHTIAHDERDFAVDIGADGESLGDEIRFASKHPDVVAEALQVLQRGPDGGRVISAKAGLELASSMRAQIRSAPLCRPR
jgi:uncharacterized protein YuzE